MSPKLDKRLPKATNVVWRTVEKEGWKFTLQVCICPEILESLVAEAIEARNSSQVFSVGPTTISLTRQL